MAEITIIVPAYNAEKYLRKCLNSLIKQTYKDFKVIIVNDGSKDSTLSICEEYVNKDKRFNVVTIENGGLSNARNTGLKSCDSKYVMFFDADDWLDKNALKKLIKLSNEADLCIGATVEIWPHVNLKSKLKDKVYHLSSNDEETIEFISDFPGGVVARLFRNDIIKENNMKFDTTVKNGEDIIFIHEYLTYIDNVATTNDVVFNYNKIEERTLSSTFNINFNKWRKLEFEARLKAYNKYIKDDDTLKKIIAKIACHYFDENIMDYFSFTDENEDICKKKIKDFCRYYSPYIYIYE